MKPKFVQTSNVKKFLAAVAALDDRAAPEACFAVVQGPAGLGKTRTATWYALKTNAVMLTIKEAMSPTWLLRDLVHELGEQVPASRAEQLYQQAVGILARERRPIVVDEVERSITNIKVLESLRDVSDLLEIPIILVGREYTLGKLKRHPQIHTRVSARCDFHAVNLEDVKLCVTELCEVPVAEDVVNVIHDQSDGLVREMMKAIRNVERIGLRNQGKEVTLDQVSGKTLCHEISKTKAKKVA